MNPLQSPAEYEAFVYTMQQHYSCVRRSTLTVIRHGATAATLTGELDIDDYRFTVRETLSFAAEQGHIVSYGYEVWRGNEKQYWYDSQPHPDDAALAATAPHHKHVPPDIKHNRVPAPHLSFAKPNLPALIEEVERLRAE